MRHRVHRLTVHPDTVHDELERFLNLLEGDLVAVVPYVTPVFMPFGGAARTSVLLVVERIAPATPS